jgi:hypothetical protein
MMHYHGTPITPNELLFRLAGHNFCVSYARPDQVKIAHQIGQSVMLDNGAFSNWTRAREIDWHRWALWAERWLDFNTTWAVLPDLIDGTEEENDQLVAQWQNITKGVPVWHLHESLDRLSRLVDYHGRVCFGSSGAYEVIGSDPWHRRVTQAFNVLADDFGRVPWVHMLRGMSLSGEIYPFASVDSTDVGRNHNRVGGDVVSIARRWDGLQCPSRWTKVEQLELDVTAPRTSGGQPMEGAVI